MLKANIWLQGESRLALIASMWAEYGLAGAQVALNEAMAANAFGLVVAGTVAVALALDSLIGKYTELSEAQRRAMSFDQDTAERMQIKMLALDYMKAGMSKEKAQGLAISDEKDMINKKIDSYERAQLRLYGDGVKATDNPAIQAAQKKIDELTKRRDSLDAIFNLPRKDDPLKETPKLTGNGKASGAAVGTGSTSRNVVVNITNLVKELSVHAATIKESGRDIEKEMTNILVRALRDAEVAIG